MRFSYTNLSYSTQIDFKQIVAAPCLTPQVLIFVHFVHFLRESLFHILRVFLSSYT